MKTKILSIFIAILLVCGLIISKNTVSYANGNTSLRVINLVYDDSGSMIQTNSGKKVDTWCQAKYAMEVFAAMLNENDTMNVYVMSDFENGTSGTPKLRLKGSDSTKTNVNKVHNMVTNAGNTPFNSVRKAKADLETLKADEKWLVILTDGEFEDGGISKAEIDKFLADKPKDLKIMYLAMGTDAGSITANENKDIYYVKAKNNDEILKKLTGIGTQVFNLDRLEVKGKSNTISFDIPMRELIVFAQGENVEIKGIENEKGEKIKSSREPVTVKYSKKAANNYSDFIVDKSLKGSIATFKGKFKAGKYEVNVKNAKTIEVYYKPDVEIAAYLKKGDKEVTNLSDLEAGEYTIDFALVKGGTKKKIKKSSLLGDVKYEAKVTNNDKIHEKAYKAGDTIKIEEGPLSIDATAYYLGYHTVETHLDYSIYKDKTLDFQFKDSPEYNVDSKGFTNGDEPIIISATIDGKEFTDEQWSQADTPKIVYPEEDVDYELGKFDVKKTDKKGVYEAYPTLPEGKPTTGTYEDVDVTVKYNSTVGKESWTGKSKDTLKLNDERNWIERNRDKIIKGLVLLAILALICGYIPPFKKRLPKGLKKSPTIEGVPRKIGVKPITAKGSYLKDTSSSLIPYKAETGTIRFAPRDVAGIPAMRVKAVGGNKMIIVNTKAYAGREEILFDGVSVPEDVAKPLRKGAGMTTTVTTAGRDYYCMLRK